MPVAASKKREEGRAYKREKNFKVSCPVFFNMADAGEDGKRQTQGQGTGRFMTGKSSQDSVSFIPLIAVVPLGDSRNRDSAVVS